MVNAQRTYLHPNPLTSMAQATPTNSPSLSLSLSLSTTLSLLLFINPLPYKTHTHTHTLSLSLSLSLSHSLFLSPSSPPPLPSTVFLTHYKTPCSATSPPPLPPPPSLSQANKQLQLTRQRRAGDRELVGVTPPIISCCHLKFSSLEIQFSAESCFEERQQLGPPCQTGTKPVTHRTVRFLRSLAHS